MTHDAALCVARAQGLSEGLAGLKAGLIFSPKLGRIVWNVQNTTAIQPDTRGGEAVTLDAITGSVLDRSGWSAS
jgi:hypothetical protein